MNRQIITKLWILFGAVFVANTATAFPLIDDFNGSTIDTSVWQVRTKFSDSSMTESGGNAVFVNSGQLVTVSNLPTYLDITGRFRFTGSMHDAFYVILRSDGTNTNPWANLDHGIYLGFAMENDVGQTSPNVFLSEFNWPAPTQYLGTAPYAITLNNYVDFRITDDGTNLAVYVGNLTTPIITAVDANSFGNKLGLYNREGIGGGSYISAGSVVQMDYIDVSSVPEPNAPLWVTSSAFFLLLGRSLYSRFRKV